MECEDCGFELGRLIPYARGLKGPLAVCLGCWWKKDFRPFFWRTNDGSELALIERLWSELDASL